MSGLQLNTFGSLTTRSGVKLTFQDFDKDNNGEISQQEYNSVLKEMKLDKVSLSVVDKNKDNIISKEEFLEWDQKILMQDAVNQLSSTINKDFANKTEYMSEMKSLLKDFLSTYIENYNGNLNLMAQSFEQVLPTKYEEFKANVLKDDKDTIAANVIYDIYNNLKVDANDENLSTAVLTRISTVLNTESARFIKSYSGDSFKSDLAEHLNQYLNVSDVKRIEAEAGDFTQRASAITEGEEGLVALKQLAEEFLLSAIDKGINICLGKSNIKTEVAIKDVLKKYTSVEELREDLNKSIKDLSSASLFETIIAEEKQNLIDEQNRKFTDISGFEYQVNACLLDYSRIPGYADGSQIHERGKGWNGSKNKAYEKGTELLNNDSIKSQIKSQIMTMLSTKGLTNEQISLIQNIFENVYNASVIQTLNSEGMITGRGARGLSSKGHAYINIKGCVDKFVEIFNTNIESVIDQRNSSEYDFDTVDLDFTGLNTGISTVNNDDIVKSYQTGIPLVTRKHGADYYIKIAGQIIDNLKQQMETKAKAMCTANGVKFDQTRFDIIFKNIKEEATNSCVEGTGKKGNAVRFGPATWKGAAIGGGLLGTAGFAVGTILATPLFGAILGGIATVVGGVVGTAVGMLSSGVGAVLSLFGVKKDRSVSTLNTRTLIDGFTQKFAQEYSAWVEEQKSKPEEVQ